LIGRGYYRHPGTAGVVKALGFVGNCVWQLYRLLIASSQATAGQTFYLADYQRVTTREWADAIGRELGVAPVRSLPLPAMKAVALAGDVAHALGFHNPPLTRFRLQNMLTPSWFDLSPIESISGPLPFTMEQGVQATLGWLSGREPTSRVAIVSSPDLPETGRQFVS
jgi:hypothetical protein